MADNNLLESIKWENLRNKNPKTKEAMSLLTGFVPGVSDVQSGLLASQDFQKGNYGSAALNTVGLLPFIPALGGMFIGKGSKVWNPENEQLFMQLEKQGLSPKEIWAKTGTLRGADKMLRQETSDLGSKITDNVYEGIKTNKRYEGPMSEAFKNPELYNAYPEAKNVTTGMYAWHHPEGSYQAETNTITAGGPSTTSQKNTALHELQHWVQNKERFARGADISSEADLIHSGMLRNILEKNPGINYQDAIGILPTRTNIEKIARQNYHRSAGEVEAELTRTRMNMTPEERLANYPYSGINMKKMIVRER